MSRVQRLLTTDRIFFVTVNLRRSLAPLKAGEFRLVAAAMNESRRRLGFLLCGYVLMPEQWRWSSYNNFALDKETVRRCPLRVDTVRLSESYRG